MKKAFLNWSSGKDAAFAFHLLRQQNDFSIEKLVTSINTQTNRISMHGLRRELLVKQAENIGIPLHIISLSGEVSIAAYNETMQRETQGLVAQGFTHSVFGDIFLEDLRAYREQQLEKVGLQPVFPLWKMDTSELIQDFLSAGFKAITVSVNARLLDESFCGRIINEDFLSNLPEGVDPCGENGEFHTFVFDGPIFRQPVGFQKGQIVEKFFPSAKTKEDNCFSDNKELWDSRFYYCDLFPK